VLTLVETQAWVISKGPGVARATGYEWSLEQIYLQWFSIVETGGCVGYLDGCQFLACFSLAGVAKSSSIESLTNRPRTLKSRLHTGGVGSNSAVRVPTQVHRKVTNLFDFLCFPSFCLRRCCETFEGVQSYAKLKTPSRAQVNRVVRQVIKTESECFLLSAASRFVRRDSPSACPRVPPPELHARHRCASSVAAPCYIHSGDRAEVCSTTT
jgi:hypothetical protein